MRVAVFSTKPYDREFLEAANEQLAESTPGAQHELGFYEARLTAESAPLAAGIPAVCVFVNDDVNADVVKDARRRRHAAHRAAVRRVQQR